jgi:hypothetical protein
MIEIKGNLFIIKNIYSVGKIQDDYYGWDYFGFEVNGMALVFDTEDEAIKERNKLIRILKKSTQRFNKKAFY